jgi:pimeloyl-ACP methyl ester carboxylesterase
MWDVFGLDDNGQPVQVPSKEIDRLVSRGQVYETARGLLRPGRGSPLGTLERELGAPDVLPGIDGVESWGRAAAELIGPPRYGSGLEVVSSLRTREGYEIPSLRWIDEPDETVEAFHWPEAVVVDISGVRELQIKAPERVWLEDYYYAGRDRRTCFEWRAYLGTGTLVAEGESEFEPDPTDPRQPLRARIPLLRSVGILVARFLHWMGRDKKPSRDPSFGGRLGHYEKRFPDIEKAYPDLRLMAREPNFFLKKPQPGPAIVFVHGTFSCGIPNLSLLHQLGIQGFRFEHDTFQSIATNAAELAQAVRQLLRDGPIYFIAHSRGGLVARLAAQQLAGAMRVVVRTYGTPHRGTPLANVGARAFKGLLSAGRVALGGVFDWDPASVAVKTIFRCRDLPEGLEVMRTDSEALKAMAFAKDPFELLAYAGAYDIRVLKDGACAYTLGEIVHQGFGQQSNDIVVPTESALGTGTKQPVIKDCDHFHYFSTRSIQTEIQNLQ